jgi:hypothetical protein
MKLNINRKDSYPKNYHTTTQHCILETYKAFNSRCVISMHSAIRSGRA